MCTQHSKEKYEQIVFISETGHKAMADIYDLFFLNREKAYCKNPLL